MKIEATSFAGVALKVGVVTLEQVRAAYARSGRRREVLDLVLERSASIDPTLVRRVHAARRAALARCRACGGTPGARLPRGEFRCRCLAPRLSA
ncbi:MAG: hypothetical protein AB7N76_28350 [Planctomycetota bacterium]